MRASEQISAAIQRSKVVHGKPIIVALDGGSGAGKTTWAESIRHLAGAAVIHLDDFYTTCVPEHQWPERTVAQRLEAVFDWERLCRDALRPLKAGNPARWQAFDYTGGPKANGIHGLSSASTELLPASVILLEGTYSASPPLADWIDLRILIQVPTTERHRRLASRDGADSSRSWHKVWDEVEAYYFAQVRPPNTFDLVVTENAKAGVLV